MQYVELRTSRAVPAYTSSERCLLSRFSIASELLDREQLEILGEILQDNLEFWEDMETAQEDSDFLAEDPADELPPLLSFPQRI